MASLSELTNGMIMYAISVIPSGLILVMVSLFERLVDWSSRLQVPQWGSADAEITPSPPQPSGYQMFEDSEVPSF